MRTESEKNISYLFGEFHNLLICLSSIHRSDNKISLLFAKEAITSLPRHQLLDILLIRRF